MTHCLIDPAAVIYRKQFSKVYHTPAKQQKLVLMNNADSTEQAVYSWVRQMVNWKECEFRERCSTWRYGDITSCDNYQMPPCLLGVLMQPTQVTACTCSKVAARSNKQQFWNKIWTSTMPTSAWIHCETQLQQLVTASGMNGTSDLP